MATKSHKDWVSPHKVSLLILIKYLSSTDEEHEKLTDCIKRCRHKLSLLLLEFFEVQSREVEESLSFTFRILSKLFSIHVSLEGGLEIHSACIGTVGPLHNGQVDDEGKPSLSRGGHYREI